MTSFKTIKRIVIPVRLVILAVEYGWARRWVCQPKGLWQRVRGIESADDGVKAARAGLTSGTQ